MLSEPSGATISVNNRVFGKTPMGIRLRHEVGVDRVMWESDFPHCESDWPNSRRILEKMFDGVPEEERYLMVAGNAVEFFHLDAG
jgi:predicted TIM-barrel fold metal-dependent hydrolase